MELYTLVGLLVGLFGGTFAALINLRALLDKDFQQTISTAKEKAEALMSLTGDGHEANADCNTHKKRVHACERIWKYVALVQVLFFVFSIYLVTYLALSNWADVSKHHTDKELIAMEGVYPWNLSPLILKISAYSNLFFIVLALAAFGYGRLSLKRIDKIGAYTKPPKGVAPSK